MSKFNYGGIPFHGGAIKRPPSPKPKPEPDRRRALLTAARPGLTNRARRMRITLAGKKP